ncbi:hypothetical protein PoB_005312000 [Plakobranchus ocellatus]|uniref:Uncharacterized protein n=1 Tax=Plakobranchus ocellatus TaxID=259542 RepID=A0AAV4C4R5_9GAST|nr:hypothetical protein PoB_005312000 [Plakobranchus ocellatus]
MEKNQWQTGQFIYIKKINDLASHRGREIISRAVANNVPTPRYYRPMAEIRRRLQINKKKIFYTYKTLSDLYCGHAKACSLDEAHPVGQKYFTVKFKD